MEKNPLIAKYDEYSVWDMKTVPNNNSKRIQDLDDTLNNLKETNKKLEETAEKLEETAEKLEETSEKLEETNSKLKLSVERLEKRRMSKNTHLQNP